MVKKKRRDRERQKEIKRRWCKNEKKENEYCRFIDLQPFVNSGQELDAVSIIQNVRYIKNERVGMAKWHVSSDDKQQRAFQEPL